MQFLHSSNEKVIIVQLQHNAKLGPTETKEQQLNPEGQEHEQADRTDRTGGT